jgi:two-component system sensor histidine kinase KdpD
LPLASGARTVGVLSYSNPGRTPLTDARKRQMLEALSQQATGALERALLAEEAQQVELRARAEELRTSLLSSVSHDLRTPLAAIVGSATTLLGEAGEVSAAQRTDLVRTIHEEAQRLTRLVSNLLAMTRVESASVSPKKEWVPIEEVVGAALARLGERVAGRAVDVRIPRDFPLVPVDPILIEQVFLNLVENALTHTPAGTPVEVVARRQGAAIEVEVLDRGPGLPAGADSRLFTKFFRGPGAPPGGSGLGLAICRGMVAAHGGSIEGFDRPGGGAVFRVRLPIEGQPPAVPAEPAGGEDDDR